MHGCPHTIGNVLNGCGIVFNDVCAVFGAALVVLCGLLRFTVPVLSVAMVCPPACSHIYDVTPAVTLMRCGRNGHDRYMVKMTGFTLSCQDRYIRSVSVSLQADTVVTVDDTEMRES